MPPPSVEWVARFICERSQRPPPADELIAAHHVARHWPEYAGAAEALIAAFARP
jgi:hypothetical protein